MKKIIALILVLTMNLCFAACGSKGSQEPAGENTVIVLPEADPGAGEPAASDTPAEALPEMGVEPDASQGEAPSGDTMGQTLLNDFRAQLEADSSASAQQIADTLLSNPVIEFAGASMPVEPGLLMGFGNAEIQGFKEGVMFAPAIGSIAFVGYVFVLEDETDAAAFVQTLLDNADPRWNICVEAEETVADYVGSTVFFLMCP